MDQGEPIEHSDHGAHHGPPQQEGAGRLDDAGGRHAADRRPRCLYTFLTAWRPQQNGWIVTGTKQPSLACAVGDLNSD
jgi:hypothetical protein